MTIYDLCSLFKPAVLSTDAESTLSYSLGLHILVFQDSSKRSAFPPFGKKWKVFLKFLREIKFEFYFL